MIATEQTNGIRVKRQQLGQNIGALLRVISKCRQGLERVETLDLGSGFGQRSARGAFGFCPVVLLHRCIGLIHAGVRGVQR